METFYFQRTFTRGNLKGLTIPGTIDFLDYYSFQEWVEGVNRNNAKGTVDYFVTV